MIITGFQTINLCIGVVPINDRLQLAKDLELSVVVEVKTSITLRESIEKLRESFG